MMLSTLHTTRISYGLLVALVLFAALSDFLINSAFNFLPHVVAILMAVVAFVLMQVVVNPVAEKAIPTAVHLVLIFSWVSGMFINAPGTNMVLLASIMMLMVWYGQRVSWAYGLNAAVVLVVPALLLLGTELPWQASLAYLVLLLVAAIFSYVHEITKPEPVPHSATTMPASFFMSPPPVEPEIYTPPVREVEIRKAEPVALPAAETRANVPQNECSEWSTILRELHNEMKTVTDVDGLFKRMLVFMSGAVDFSAAAVGMIQEQSINKISSFGLDALTHSSVLSWNTERLKKLAAEKQTLVTQQNQVDGANKQVLYRLDIPVITNDKLVGLVTLLRARTPFTAYENALLSSIVFYGMIALRHARLQEEIKRTAATTAGEKRTFYTREQFIGKAGQALAEYKKPRALSFMIIEVDEYAFVLKTKGQDGVMRLYKTFASTIMSMLRPNDALGAYGKEGYIVMMQDLDVLHAKEVAEQIRKKLSQLQVKTETGAATSTVSIGVTTVSDPDDDMATLMRKAGMGLFVAKESGKNAVKVSL